MESKWERSTLETVSDVKSGKRLPKGESLTETRTEHPYIRLVDIDGGRVRKSDLLYLRPETQNRIARYIVNTGDVCLAIVGHTIGMVFHIDSHFDLANLTENAARITNLQDDFDSRFLYYYLLSPTGQNDIRARKVGSAQGKLPLYNIRSMEVPKPPLRIQKAIAHILGTLDDKIELNRRMNVTLESMARALFKSWFVDFDPVIDNALAAGNPIPEPLSARAQTRRDLGTKRKPLPKSIQKLFPDAFEFDDEMGWIPDDWEVKAVADVLDRLKVRKKYKKGEVDQNGTIPVFEQGADLILGYHNDSADVSASTDNPAFIFGDHTCVTKLSVEPFSISANVIPLRGKTRDTAWVFFAVHEKQKFEEYRRHWMELIIKDVVVPPPAIASEFSRTAVEIVKNQAALSRQDLSLAKLRDTLLPKLLSGELRIPDAEKLVAGSL